MPLNLKHGVGICVVNPTVDHYVLVPDFERAFEADNDDYVVDEHVNIEFYLGDNYRNVIASAKLLLRAADISSCLKADMWNMRKTHKNITTHWPY